MRLLLLLYMLLLLLLSMHTVCMYSLLLLLYMRLARSLVEIDCVRGAYRVVGEVSDWPAANPLMG